MQFLVNVKTIFYFFEVKIGGHVCPNMSCVPPDYMTNQVRINAKMRSIEIDWVMEVQICSCASSICCEAYI